MIDLLFLALMMIPSIICVVTAGILVYNEINGWGWFLLVAIMLMVTKANHS